MTIAWGPLKPHDEQQVRSAIAVDDVLSMESVAPVGAKVITKV